MPAKESDPKNAATITVSGPGSAINLEYYLILKAFEEAGIVVEQDNPYPKEDPNSYLHSLLEEIKDKRLGMIKVKLIAQHYPWGG